MEIPSENHKASVGHSTSAFLVGYDLFIFSMADMALKINLLSIPASVPLLLQPPITYIQGEVGTS